MQKLTRAEIHKGKMAIKRARRATMKPGFVAIPNRRIDSAIDTQQAMIMFAAADAGHPISAVKAREQATRNVAAMLPRETKRRLHPLSSKSDSPAYRKAA